jgi:hypothetical protein
MSRIVKIEINPFRKQKRKFKMRVPRMGSQGVPIISADGKPQYTFQEASNLSRIPGTSTTLAAGRKPTGELATGLDVFVENPYANEEVYKYQWAYNLLKGRTKVKLQTLLEYKHGVPEGYYTSRISMDVRKSHDENATFFETAESRLVMKDNTAFLNLDNPIHEVQYYMLKAHPQVANSYAELEDGTNQIAEWYIVDDLEKENVVVTKIDKEIAAASALKRIGDDGQSITFVKALGLDAAGKTVLSSEGARRALYDYYNESDASYEDFMNLVRKWDEAPERAYVLAAAELYDWVRVGIVTYKNGKYTWVRPAGDGRASETYMHPTKTAFINNFILDPSYQEEVEMIRETFSMKSK